MQAPRPYHYQFVHRVLADDAHRPQGDTWPMVTGPQAPAYFSMKWHMCGGDPSLVGEIRFAGMNQLPGWDVLVVAMPEPIAPTEAHFVAYARPTAGGPLRFFAMEKGMQDAGQPPRAFVSEKRADGMRIRHGDLPGLTANDFVAHLRAELSGQPALPAQAGATLVSAGMPFGAPAMNPMNPMQASMPPMAMPRYQPPPPPKGRGKWIALGIVGFFALPITFGLIRNAQQSEEFREQLKAEEDRENAKKDAFADAKRTAEERLAAIGKPYDACVAGEQAAAKQAIERAQSAKALGGQLKRPKDAKLVQGAIAWDAPTAEKAASPTDTSWLPDTPWITKAQSTCAAPPPAYTDLKAEVDKPPPDSYYLQSIEERTAKLEELTEKLMGVTSTGASTLKSVVVTEVECKNTAVVYYDGTTTPGMSSLDRFDCKAKLTWINLQGEVLAALIAQGGAAPASQPEVASYDTLAGIDATTKLNAMTNMSDTLEKTIGAWGGAK